MGIPYSKQINAAFDQVTPLVAAGFEVLQTTKNISILLAAIQVLTVVSLFLILLTLLCLLITLNPNLESERDALVTPIARAFAKCMLWLAGLGPTISWALGIVAVGCVLGALAGLWYTGRDPTLSIEGGADGKGEAVEGEDERKGEDIEAVKKGQTNQ